MRSRPCVLAFLSLFLVVIAGPARAAMTVSLVTFGPGEQIYERFGHNGIRVRDDERGVDQFFDWGHFEFTPDFMLKFAKGDLHYWMDGTADAQRLIDFYIRTGDRQVTEQILNLSPAQVERLYRALFNNLKPKNRTYRYDYYLDNCSTRARDMLDQATDGAIRRALDPLADHTFRFHTRRLMPVGVLNTLCTTLADMAGGPRIDRPLTRWEASFVPMLLADGLDEARNQMEDGTIVPLVLERRVLHTTTTAANADPDRPWNPTRWTLPFSLLTSGLMLLLARRGWRRAFALIASLWQGFVLFAACSLPAMALFTWHWPVAWNANLLQFTPLSVLVLLALWRQRWRRPLQWAATGAVGLSAAGAILTIAPLPFAPQQNGSAVALALPLHVATMIGLRWITRPPTSPSAGQEERTPAS